MAKAIHAASLVGWKFQTPFFVEDYEDDLRAGTLTELFGHPAEGGPATPREKASYDSVSWGSIDQGPVWLGIG